MLDILCTYQEIDIDKARQLGITWLVVNYGLWVALFNETAKNLYISQGEKEAWELISKTRFSFNNLPDYLKKDLVADNRAWISFKDSDSEMNALASTDKAGSGYNATVVIRDELYNHPMGEQNFSYIAPSIDAGGQMINLSAVYGDDMNNHFVVRVKTIKDDPATVKKVYPSGLELYTNHKYPSRALVFLGWKLRPVRLEGLTLDEFYETRLKPRYTPRELDRQYPSNIEDQLRISISGAYFEHSALEDMAYQICQPIEQKKFNTYNNIVRVYTLPIAGRHYVVFTDPSGGAKDPFVTGVMDFVTGEVVCSAMGIEEIDKVAEIHNYLVREYNDATNSYEYNASCGGEMFGTLQRLKTPNQAPRRKTDGTIDIDKKGQTVSMEHKLITFGYLSFGIGKRKYTIHDREFTQQAKMVTRDKDALGRDKVGTDRNQSFDWVMMMAGLCQLEKYFVPTESWQPTSTKYKY